MGLWGQEVHKVFVEMSGPKEIPVIWGLRASREIQGPSVRKGTEVRLVRRAIPVRSVLLGQKANAVNKVHVVRPENRGLSECRARKAN